MRYTQMELHTSSLDNFIKLPNFPNVVLYLPFCAVQYFLIFLLISLPETAVMELCCLSYFEPFFTHRTMPCMPRKNN